MPLIHDGLGGQAVFFLAGASLQRDGLLPAFLAIDDFKDAK
jgi:hypothetical protein